MGTTASFYYVKNIGFAENAIREKLKNAFPKAYQEKRNKIISFDAIQPGQVQAITDKAGMDEIVQMFLEKLNHGDGITDSDQSAFIAYKEDAKWFPLFETRLCEGYLASNEDAIRLSKSFSAPVLAFSIFDSDILFLLYSDVEHHILCQYAKNNFEKSEGYDVELYDTGFPEFLLDFCKPDFHDQLKAVWNADEVFADDRMSRLCQVLGAEIVYGVGDVPKAYRIIDNT